MGAEVSWGGDRPHGPGSDGAGPLWGGASAAATNGLNEAGGTAPVVPAEWSARAGRTRAGP